MKLITGNSHQTLAKSLAKCLSIPLVNCSVQKFSNSEIEVKINENVRNEHIFILQTGGFDEHNSINDFIMEALILIDACRRSNAKSITLLMPCYPYARQDKKDAPRVPISSKLIANMFTTSGIDRMISLDLHASQIQGFFDIPFDNLYAITLLSEHFEKHLFKNMTDQEKNDKYVFVSPDNGGAKRIMAYSKRFNINNVIMHKQRDYSTSSKVDKVILVGGFDLKNKTAIIVDDMADTMGTVVKASDTLIENGIKDIIVVVTHGILSGPALERINTCDNISRVIVTNTLAQEANQERCPKLDVVDITPLLCDVVMCIRTGESISHMFE